MNEYWNLQQKITDSKDVKIESINRNEIDEVDNIKIDKNLPAKERIIEYIKKVKNPYILKVNDTLVKITFNNQNIECMQCLKNIVKNNA